MFWKTYSGFICLVFGAPVNKDVSTFKLLGRGISTTIFEYSKSREGGEKDEWSLGLTVVVN